MSEGASSGLQPGFLRKVALLTGAAALGQFLNFAVSPLITRLFTPGDFGISGTFAVVVGLFQVVACGRYENAIALPRSQREGLQIVKLCLAILFCLVTLSTILVLGWGPTVWLPARLENLRSYFLLLPWGFFALGFFTIAEFWAIRQSYFEELSKTKVWQGLASISVQLLAGFGHWGARGLVVAFVVGQSAGALRLWRLLWRDLRNDGGFQWDWPATWLAAARFRNFPLLTTWASGAKILGQYFPLLFFSVHFGAEATGWLAFAQRILALPLILVGESVSRAYLSAAARLRSQGEARAHAQLFFRVVRGQVGLALFVLLPGLLLAPKGFEFFFGPVWRQAGVLALYSGLGLAAQLIVTPIHCQLDVAERQKLSMLGEVARWLCLGGAAYMTLHSDLAPANSAFFFGLANAGALSVVFAMCCWSLGEPPGTPVPTIALLDEVPAAELEISPATDQS